MKFATLILCLLSSTFAFAGQTGGGGTPALTLEIMRVLRGASTISDEVYGVPDNFTLDDANKRVSFKDEFEMTYDQVKQVDDTQRRLRARASTKSNSSSTETISP